MIELFSRCERLKTYAHTGTRTQTQMAKQMLTAAARQGYPMDSNGNVFRFQCHSCDLSVNVFTSRVNVFKSIHTAHITLAVAETVIECSWTEINCIIRIKRNKFSEILTSKETSYL